MCYNLKSPAQKKVPDSAEIYLDKNAIKVETDLVFNSNPLFLVTF